jgi:hypothetical protein
LMMHMRNVVLAACLLVAHVHTQAGGEAVPRVEIGAGYSVAAPAGRGWIEIGAPGAYFMPIAPQGHGLLLVATTWSSGISREEILDHAATAGQDGLVRIASRFVTAAWKAHRASLAGERFENVEVVNDVGGEFAIGPLLCGYSRISGRDHGALIDGVPAQVRYVGYSCAEFPDLSVAATVSYLERGPVRALSDQAMAIGERFARSLQRCARGASFDAASARSAIVRTAMSAGSGRQADARSCR